MSKVCVGTNEGALVVFVVKVHTLKGIGLRKKYLAKVN